MTTLYNAEAAGSELISIRDDRNRSTQDLIVNEDWCMVMKVLTCENGLISATKVWDEKDTEGKIFYATFKYAGAEGTPPDASLTVGQHVVFHRVGGFNSAGVDGFELKTENADNASWVCFLDTSTVTWVYDLGDGTGYETYYDGSAWVQIGDALTLIATDTHFYTGTPPWYLGRVLLGQRQGSNLIVHLMGYGPQAQIFSFTAGGVTFQLTTDSTGKVLSFVGE